jgi:N-acetylglucosaminyl-diphospho-decaprenol L-rhamnosyltransferase
LKPFVHVLIVSYKSFPDIFDCIDALSKSRYEYFDVTICENGSLNDYQSLTSRLPNRLPLGQTITSYHSPNNDGFAAGINFLLDRVSGTDAYWILNPDAIPFSDTLQSLVARLNEGDSQAIGHDIVWPDGRLASRGGGTWNKFTARAISLDYGKARGTYAPREIIESKINYLIGASMLISSEFLAHVGRMRNDYFLYCEEVEWFLRAAEVGQKIGYDPSALVVHRHGTSTGGGGALVGRSRVSVYLSERSKILLTRDRYPTLLPIAAIFVLLHCIRRYARAGAWRQLVHALSGWFAGLRNERGPPLWLAKK